MKCEPESLGKAKSSENGPRTWKLSKGMKSERKSVETVRIGKNGP